MFELKLYYPLDELKKHPLFTAKGDIDKLEELGEVLRGTSYDGFVYTLDLPGVKYGEIGKIGSNPIGYCFELRPGNTIFISKDCTDDAFCDWYMKHKNDEETFVIEKVDYEEGSIWIENCPYELPYDCATKVAMY